MLRSKARDYTHTDQHNEPTVPLVLVDPFVPEEADDKSDKSNDQDGNAGWQLAVSDIVEDIGAGNRVDHGPPYLVEEVDESNQLRWPEAKGEPLHRQCS